MNPDPRPSERVPTASALQALAKVPGVRDALLVGRDGLTIAGGEGEDTTAALTAAMYGAIERALTGMSLGRTRYVIVGTESHHLHAVGLDRALLVVLTEPSTDAALVRRAIGRAVQMLELPRTESHQRS